MRQQYQISDKCRLTAVVDMVVFVLIWRNHFNSLLLVYNVSNFDKFY